jgi:outer membrane protein assembly factor BamB
MKTRALLAVMAGLLALTARADDWPQFRGPNRDGISKETGLLKKWPKDGPKLVWTYKDAGAGYSSPSVVGDRLYLTGARGDDEYLFALDLKESPPKQVWKVKIGPTFTWKGNIWNAGPSSSPTVADGFVYALGGGGELVCVGVKDGKEKWRKNLPADLGGEVNPVGGGYGSQAADKLKLGWGYAGSPLVDGDNVVCVPGGPKGTFAALKKDTGAVAWRSDDLKEQATYSSPVICEAGGKKQYVVTLQDGAAAVGAADGKLLWRYKREAPYQDIVAGTPVVKDNFVFISAAGSGGGCDLIEVKKGAAGLEAARVYANDKLANFHGGAVLVGDHVYGASGDFGGSRWVCLGFKTGDAAWSETVRRLGKGSVTAADGALYLLGENGLVVRAPASPTEKLALTADNNFKLPEESSLRKPNGKVWTYPVIANGKLYLRDQDLLFCYEVK